MPDLQSELKKLDTIAFDDEGVTTTEKKMLPHAFKPTNNVSRETFNCIRENPGLTRSQIGSLLEKKGFKKSSVISLATQFLKQGMIRSANGGLLVAQPEYTPVKTTKSKKPSKDMLPKPQKAVAKVTAPPASAIYISGLYAQSTKELLEGMSIVQAREVYDELKKVFSA